MVFKRQDKPKQKQETLLCGEKAIAEFGNTQNDFGKHEGYVAQPILPLSLPILKQTSIGQLKMRSPNLSRLHQSAYGYFRVFVKEEVVKTESKGMLAAYGMARMVKHYAERNPNFMLCHAVESSHSASVEVWTVTAEKVVNIHSLVHLPKDKRLFIQEFQDAMDAYRLDEQLRNHDIYLMADDLLDVSSEEKYRLPLFERCYQIEEEKLRKQVHSIALVNPTESDGFKVSVPTLITLGILAAGPAISFSGNWLYESRFNEEKSEYLALAQTIKGLDEEGRNTAEVALWEARDTHLRQQGIKSLDTNNLEMIVKAISAAANSQESKILVKTIDYSRVVKHRSGFPDYHFRIELLISKNNMLSEGSTIDAVYKDLGQALADITEEFVSPGNPRESQVGNENYYRVEFIGRFTNAVLKGGSNV